MLLPDVWMKITLTGKSVPVSSRKFWNSIMVERRQSRIEPFMRISAERAEILGAMGKMPD